MACVQYRATDPYAVAPQCAGPVRFTFTRHTRHAQYHVQAPIALRLLPSAVHILFRARPAVQSAYDANSTFVIRPDALAGFATDNCTVGPAVCCGRAWRRRREKVVPQRIHEGGRIHHPICACLDREGGRIHHLSGVIGVTSVREDESITSEGGRIHHLIRL